MTPRQIKAARVLLDWKQSELAKRAGLSKTALIQIEGGCVLPRQKNLIRLQHVLEQAGVEFLDMNGVRLKTEQIAVKSDLGSKSNAHYFDDILATLKIKGGEVFHSCVDDKFMMTHFRSEMFHYYTQMRELGFKEKILLEEGDQTRYVPSDTAEYRWVKKELFDQIGYSVYGDKIALFLHSQDWPHIIIENARLADAYRSQFMRNWKNAMPAALHEAKYLDELERTQLSMEQ